MAGHGLDWSGSGQEEVVGFWECCDDLWGQYNAGNFLVNWGTVSFSRTLLHGVSLFFLVRLSVCLSVCFFVSYIISSFRTCGYKRYEYWSRCCTISFSTEINWISYRNYTTFCIENRQHICCNDCSLQTYLYKLFWEANKAL